MDEVFSSTNVIEGVSGTFRDSTKISTFTNVCAIVTTHLLYLTKLKSFVKYKMNVQINDEDGITFPYILNLPYKSTNSLPNIILLLLFVVGLFVLYRYM